jgi:WD40 repeat protein
MTTTDPAWRSLARMTYLNQQTGLNFARSISFAPNGQYVAVRYYQNELRLYSLAAPSSRPPPTIQLDNWPSSVPPNWPNLRPVMAAIETADSHWRIAWPTASGIVAGDGEYGGSLKPLEPLLNKTTDTLYSNSSDIMRLKFSGDGHFLASESKTFGRQATVQVWDLSAGRQAFIDSLTELDALRAEACSVAGITGPAELQQDDMYALFGQKVDQPCPRR